jgi:hypothetical protein
MKGFPGRFVSPFFMGERHGRKKSFHAPNQLGTRKIAKNAAMIADTNNKIAIVAVGTASCTVPRASLFARPPMT